MIKTPEFEFASKEEAIWLKVKESTEARIKNMEESLIIDREILKLCESKLKELGK